MKATGIVRRIDDLGRVVIPKEIRRTLRIREGDPLEIYTDRDGEVIFKKYSPIGELGDFAAQLCDTLNKTTGHVVAVSDRDSIIAAAGAPRRELCDKPVGAELERVMHERQVYTAPSGGGFVPAEGAEKFSVGVASPILAQGDVLGCVMFLRGDDSRAQLGETESKLAQTVSAFLGRQMED